MKVVKPENRGYTRASTGSGRGPESLFGFMSANYKASRPMRQFAQATAKRGELSFDRKIQIASFSEEISKSDVRCVASSRLRKKTGGFTSFILTEFRIAQRRTSSRVPKPPASR